MKIRIVGTGRLQASLDRIRALAVEEVDAALQAEADRIRDGMALDFERSCLLHRLTAPPDDDDGEQ